MLDCPQILVRCCMQQAARRSRTSQILRFADFEVDLRTGELRRDSIRIPFQDQPFQVLKLLLQHPGEIVAREKLRQRLWHSDTFVDFDNSLNTAINKIREALGDSAETPRFVETLPRRGYRFIAEVSPVGAATAQVEPVRTGLSRLRIPLLSRARGTRLLVLAVTVSVALVLFQGLRQRRVSRLRKIQSLAVLPLENLSQDPGQEYFAEGMTEELIHELSKIRALKVISRTSVMRYKGRNKSLPEIARELNVDGVVEGSVERSGERVRITAQLIEARADTHLWGESYERDLRDVMSVQDEVARAIAKQIQIELTPQEKLRLGSARKKGTENPEAYELYLKGRYYWNKRTGSDIDTAISYFNQAIAKDPSYALAYSGLADAYSTLPYYGGTSSENYPKSNAAARKALELDATLAHPHAVLGFSEAGYEWDFAGGEAEFKKAFELDPNDATAHQWHANIISDIGGREQEALAEINRAHQLDPLSPMISVQAGYVHFNARQYDEVIVICKKVASENSTFAPAHFCLALGYWGKRMYLQVIEEWKAFGQFSNDRNESDFASAMEQGFRSAGWRRALTKGIEARRAQRKTGYYSPYMIAMLCADLGDKDQAFEWLNTDYQEHDRLLLSLKTDFQFDPLRSDPRFAELVRRVGLPQ
jgi:TolB-like protein/DNA-binding winged helix-turn-helix (wHTH) protein